MLFNSGAFLFFFVAVYLAYRLVPHRWQNRLLLVASYFFYGYWDYRFLGLIFVSTAVDYAAGRRIDTFRTAGDMVAAKRWLSLSVAVNLGILGFFKYFNFFAESLQAALAPFGLELAPFTLSVILPVGISFYTFQTMSYCIDVYRGHARATTDFLDFSLFVAFFPQLMAGPIERFGKLFPQIQGERTITRELVVHGGWLVFWGLFKKVFIADKLAAYTAFAAIPDAVTTGADAWLVMFAFAIRFYCDFSGYSDMAIGLAALMGFRLSLNFYLPFFSRSPGEFWTRWHITLGTWFRDYVYRPLCRRWYSGTRAPITMIVAGLVTAMLAGLWHGADWRFVVFGLAWGLWVVVEWTVSGPLTRMRRLAPALDRGLAVVGTGTTFVGFLLIGSLFIAPTLSHAGDLVTLMFSDLSYSTRTLRDAWTVLYYCAPLIVMQIAQRLSGRLDVVFQLPVPVRVGVYCMLTLLLAGAGAESEHEFIYFQF